MNPIRTLVVDDEPLAREGILALLAQDPEVEVVGSCADGQSAVNTIRAQRPDLVFLDVQMPKRDGFGVLAELAPGERPLVIFVTAFDQYAIRAFEAHAIGYLLKPFTDARFSAALAHAKAGVRDRQALEFGRKIDHLLGYVRQAVKPGVEAKPDPAPADRVVLKTGSDLHFVHPADIIWIESQADFVKFHTTGAAQLVRGTMQDFEKRLDPARFLRIHRSTIVNMEHVRKVTPALYGDYTVLMSDESKLRLSRKNRDKMKQLNARLSRSADTR